MAETVESLAELLHLGPQKALQPPRFAKCTAVSGDTCTVTIGGSSAEAVRCCLCAAGDVVLLETLPNGTLAAVTRRTASGQSTSFPGVVSAHLSSIDTLTPVAGNQSALSARDANDIYIGQLRSYVYADGSTGLRLVARHGTSNGGGIKQSTFGIDCALDGTATYTMSNPENLRSAIGAAAASDAPQRYTISAATTYTISNNYRGVMYVIDSTAANCGEYLVYSTGSGAVNTVPVKAASNITIATGTRSLALTPTSGSRALLVITHTGTWS